jgi:hypothetical protein
MDGVVDIEGTPYAIDGIASIAPEDIGHGNP